METELRNEFLAQQIDMTDAEHNEVVTLCAQICRTHGLSPNDLVCQWSADCVNKGIPAKVPSFSEIEDMQKQLELDNKRKNKGFQSQIVENQSFTKDNISTMFEDDFLDAFQVDGDKAKSLKVHNEETPMGVKRQSYTTPARRANKLRQTIGSIITPISASKQSPTSTPGAAKSYETRDNAGKIEFTYNPSKFDTAQLKRTLKQSANQESIIAVYPNCVEKPYRHMFEKLRDRADVLDERIDVLGDRMIKKFKLLEANDENGDSQELAHVALPNQEQVVVVGRVCVDATGEGKLNARSVLLEGSRDTSSGARVLLDLTNVPDFSLFPGQIIACQGTNTTGTVFSPSVIFPGAPFPLPHSTPDMIREHYFPDDGEDVKMIDIIVASGPFSTSQDLTFTPLMDLLDVVRRDPPDVLVLLGPFIDEDHPLIKKCEVDVTFEELFQDIVEQVTEVIINQSKSCEVVFIPSLSDVAHHKVYPQPPFSLSQEHERVHAMANPATFTVKEVTIGVSTVDVIKHLSQQETSFGQTGDRLGRLANHIIQQQSYYPIVPTGKGVNMEFDHEKKIRLPKVTPDILLLPSDMKYFIKNINGCVTLNPGRLVKHNTGGTYARLSIHAPGRLDIPEDSKPIPHGIFDRTDANILRI
eukprot:m.216520 g.216520  ORF g.216520 m.216520 type:complete len:642 (+) comp15879_c0_seq5:111-2036(+)